MISNSNRLRKELSMHHSGLLLNETSIPVLKEEHYIVEDITLDGDAPKQFIRVYKYTLNSDIRKSNPKTWIPYIAKTAEKWYPHESVIEYMINRIGQNLGLVMNDIALMKINGQIRFLSKFFLKKDETLVHGAEILGEYLDDMELATQIANEKITSREFFTFEFIYDAIKFKFNRQSEILIRELIKMITFDCLVGNNDRHFYNWGIITNTKKTTSSVQFSPLYDSARGLLWNSSDDWVIRHLKLMDQNGKKVKRYIEEACPRISVEGNSKINHFDLIKHLKNNYEPYSVVIETMASVENEEKVIEMLKKEFFGFYIQERGTLIEYIIKQRFKKVRGI